MAETKPSDYSTRSLSYVLGAEAIPANLPDLVLHALCNDIDLTGEPTGQASVPVHSDLGAASPGTYGTAISTNTTLAHGSAITFTIVEGALVRGLVLDTAIERKFPGMSGVEMLMQEGTFQQKQAALQEEVNRLSSMCLETYETDHCLLTTGLSNSVGTTVQPLTVNDILSAIYTYDTLEAINRETALFLWPVQVRDLTADLLVNGGGLGGGAWGNMDTAFLQRAALPKNGFIDTFLKRPVYQGSHSLRTLTDTSTNVNGAMIAIGRGNPMTSAGTGIGAFAHARSGWLKTRFQYSPADRGMIVVVAMEYVAGELRDSHGVRIKSSAT